MIQYVNKKLICIIEELILYSNMYLFIDIKSFAENKELFPVIRYNRNLLNPGHMELPQVSIHFQ